MGMLALDIGNTAIKAGLFTPEGLRVKRLEEGSDIKGGLGSLLEGADANEAVICSVVHAP